MDNELPQASLSPDSSIVLVATPTVVVQQPIEGSNAPWVILAVAVITMVQTIIMEIIRQKQTAKAKSEQAVHVAEVVVSKIKDADVTPLSGRTTPSETPAAKSES